MTTTSSDKPNLRHGSISSAPAPDVQQSPQQQRHVRSRLSIIPLPCRDEPVQRTSRKSRTSFSASSFSHRTSTPDLRIYSHPLNPQEIHDLAVTSLEPPGSQLRDVATPSDTASGGTNVTPKPKFITLSNGLYLPFVDRQSEVASLLQHSANASTLTLIELAFSDEKQLSDFRRLLFNVPREEVDDVKWISTIRAILKPRSEILWARLKTILGVPPELDADDYQLKAFLFGRSLSNIPSNIPENAPAQWVPSDQSTTLARSLTAPPSKQGTQSPGTTSPIIEEVESADSNVSGQDQDPDLDSFHALCFQTAPSFIPCTDSTDSENAAKPSIGVGTSNVKQLQRIKDQGHDLEPSQIRDVSSPSSGSTGSNTSFSRGIRFASLRRPSAQHDHDTLRPTSKGIPQRGRSPLSQSVTNSEKEEVKGGDKKSEEGHESDVSGASSASLDREKKQSVEGGSQIMTGTGDVARPRKPSLRSDKTSDVPSRDLPPSTPTSDAICQKGENKQSGESRLDQTFRTTSKATPRRTRRPSTSSRIQSPSLSTISLSENAFSDHPITSSPVVKGRPRFPASFSKSPIARKPRAVTAWHSGQATDTGSAKQRSTGHPRSHTVSSVPTQPQQTNVPLSQQPAPPPSPETPGTPSSSTTAENVRPRRAMSLIQRRPRLSRQSSKSSSKTGEEKEDKDKSKSSVEVEGLKDGVRGTKNPLFGA